MITAVHYEFSAFPTRFKERRFGKLTWTFDPLSLLRFDDLEEAKAEVKRLKKIYVRVNAQHRKDPNKPALLNRSEVNGYGPTFLRIFKVVRMDMEGA